MKPKVSPEIYRKGYELVIVFSPSPDKQPAAGCDEKNTLEREKLLYRKGGLWPVGRGKATLWKKIIALSGYREGRV